jgi:peptide/nickel transport system substrate-binding protein
LLVSILHKKLGGFSLAAVLCLHGFAGCDSSWRSSQPSGYLVTSIESDPTQLDPRYATDANSVRLSKLIFSSLTRLDRNSRLEPDLAEQYEMKNTQTYWFRLRRGVFFHNGQPLTSADVKYTYESVLDPKNQSPWRAAMENLKSIETPGPNEIIFRLDSPYAPFLEQTTLGIVPAGTPPPNNQAAQSLIGSGPFSFGDFDPGEKVVLKANPSYWEGQPEVSGIMVKIIPDAIVRVLEFKKGTLHLLQNDIEPDTLPWIQERTHASVLITPGTTFQYLGINLSHPILRHAEVRRALAMAIDRETLIHHLLKGLAVPATGLLSPSHWAYEPAVKRWPYDPEAAKRLLDAAGYPDPDGAGPRPRFKLSYKTTTLDLRRRIAEVIKEQLAQVGIELEVRTYEWGTFYADVKKGNFDLYSLSWVGVADPDVYFNLFHSSSVPPRGDNRGYYRNQEIDRLLEKGRASVSSSERVRLYSRVQKLLALDLPCIPLWWQKNVVVMQPNLRGFTPYPDGDLASLKSIFFTAPPPAL